jgi:hypothetical protein
MKIILTCLLSLFLGASLAQAKKCKDCGCKEKCSAECQCKHDKKTN